MIKDKDKEFQKDKVVKLDCKGLKGRPLYTVYKYSNYNH